MQLFFFQKTEAEPSFSQGSIAITTKDYCDFLNGVAITDDRHLYDEKMAIDVGASCIKRLGAPGYYSYKLVGGDGAEEIFFLKWLDAARYCHWKENQSPFSEKKRSVTETGIYELAGDQLISTKLNGMHFIASSAGAAAASQTSFDLSLRSNQKSFVITGASTMAQAAATIHNDEESLTALGIFCATALAGGAGYYYREQFRSVDESSRERLVARATEPVADRDRGSFFNNVRAGDGLEAAAARREYETNPTLKKYIQARVDMEIARRTQMNEEHRLLEEKESAKNSSVLDKEARRLKKNSSSQGAESIKDEITQEIHEK